MTARKTAKTSWETTPPPPDEEWRWPIEVTQYDRSADLSPTELQEVAYLVARNRRHGHWPHRCLEALARLRQPVVDALTVTGADLTARSGVLKVLLRAMAERQTTYWAWSGAVWRDTLGTDSRALEKRYLAPLSSRHHLIGVAYLLELPLELDALGPIRRLDLVRKVFGRARVDAAIRKVCWTLAGWGYRDPWNRRELHMAVCDALLANRSPRLEDLTLDGIEAIRQSTTRRHLRDILYGLARALHGLGIADRMPARAFPIGRDRDPTVGVPVEWVAWCQRWLATSTLETRVRQAHYLLLLKAGRWVAREHPEATRPELWTRELAASYVAAVDRMTVGQWASQRRLPRGRVGKPLSAKAKMHHFAAMSAFFRDAHEWGWLERRFDPRRCFAAPRTVRALIGPNPRVLADDVWAKLVWAGLNLKDDDLSLSHGIAAHYYPATMVRALAVVWLFAGLRASEIHRLRVGCVRWQREDVPVAGTGDVLQKNAVCLLDVPTNKTGVAFTKPVDRAVGEAIAAWEQDRPSQPAMVDAKTGEIVQVLFAHRGARVGDGYLNGTLIPLLCRKAGIPEHDARGDITSHRARSTIASQLFNAREPMSLFELQAWLGHRWAASTQHYVAVAPTRLAKAYADAGYFARNVRTIEVLIDRDVVKSGAAAKGEPWRFYDLGHGLCTYEFFDQCPHRMACAKCAFYRPKGSSQAQLLEAKANLLRLRQEIPLTEDEAAAVDDGVEALERLCTQLADVPTPAGPTPRQLAHRRPIPLPVSPAPAGPIASDTPRRHAEPSVV